jgi:hypothetical protein
MKRHSRFVSTVIIVLTAAAAPAAWARGRPTDRAVTSTVHAAGAAGNHHIESDGLGNYTNSNGVVSRLQSTNEGEWELDTRTSSSPVRRMRVWEPAWGPGAASLGIPWGELFVARFITHCGEGYQYDPPYPGPGNMKGLGSTLDCAATFAFAVGSDIYRFHMGGGAHPGSDKVTLTCISVVDGGGADTEAQCDGWSFGPLGGAAQNEVHVTGEVKDGGKKQVTKDFGYYYVKFGASFTEP